MTQDCEISQASNNRIFHDLHYHDFRRLRVRRLELIVTIWEFRHSHYKYFGDLTIWHALNLKTYFIFRIIFQQYHIIISNRIVCQRIYIAIQLERLKNTMDTNSSVGF